MSEIQPGDLWQLLGFPDGPTVSDGGNVEKTSSVNGITIDEVVVEASDGPIQGTVLRKSGNRNCPAVLYCHAHGNRYDIGRRELLEGRPALLRPYGPELARLGFVVLCLDMPGFHDRIDEGSESALSKSALWQGHCMFGKMLSDLAAGLDYLTKRDDVDSGNIATLGLSMGATHAYWLAALDRRVSRAAHLCAFSNIRPLIGTTAHDLHGHYMTVPGLLNRWDMADIAAFIAPRPQLIGCGKLDPLTPPAALEPAIGTVRRAYIETGAPDALSVMISAETGHTETQAMRVAVVKFLLQSSETE